MIVIKKRTGAIKSLSYRNTVAAQGGQQSQKQKRVSKSRPMAWGFSSTQRAESAGMLFANLQGATRRGRISQGALSPRSHRLTVCTSRRLRFVRVLLHSDRDDVNDLLNYGVTRRKEHTTKYFLFSFISVTWGEKGLYVGYLSNIRYTRVYSNIILEVFLINFIFLIFILICNNNNNTIDPFWNV